MQLGGPNCKEIDKPTKTFFIFNWDKVLSVHMHEGGLTDKTGYSHLSGQSFALKKEAETFLSSDTHLL